MKNKFKFYERVTVIAKDINKIHALKSHCGHISGMAQNEETGKFSYSVFMDDIYENWCFYEEELQSLGTFVDEDKFQRHGSIRVTVNENGEGDIKKTYGSITEIEQEINKLDAHKVSGHMIEVGMLSDDINAAYNLINTCIRSHNEMIRVAGYNALWHLLLRFKTDLPSEQLMKFIRIGLKDKNKQTSEIISYILEDLQHINPIIWQQIEKYN